MVDYCLIVELQSLFLRVILLVAHVLLLASANVNLNQIFCFVRYHVYLLKSSNVVMFVD